MLEVIRKIEPHFKTVRDAIITSSRAHIGWHCTALDSCLMPLGSGLAEEKNTARRIAVAEVIERGLAIKLARSKHRHRFLISEFPTTCGFAAGFDREATRFRAICEAYERWAWSKWIDDGHTVDQLHAEPTNLSSLAVHFASKFQEVLFFSRSLGNNLHFAATLGLTERGIFPGSRVSTALDDLWTHAIVEAWRHKQIVESAKRWTKNTKFLDDRITYFAGHRDEGLAQIKKAIKATWPNPSLRILEEYKTGFPGVFLFRALCNDFLGWHAGSHKRFVY